MGSSRHITFEDCIFLSCSLVVVAGAHATLMERRFRDMDSFIHRLSIFAGGAESQVVIQSGIILGGVHGVVVQAGARLEASDLIIKRG